MRIQKIPKSHPKRTVKSLNASKSCISLICPGYNGHGLLPVGQPKIQGNDLLAEVVLSVFPPQLKLECLEDKCTKVKILKLGDTAANEGKHHFVFCRFSFIILTTKNS